MYKMCNSFPLIHVKNYSRIIIYVFTKLLCINEIYIHIYIYVYNVKNNWRIRRIAIICSNFPPLTTRTIPFFIFPIYNFLLFAQQHEICKSRTVNRAQIYNRPILTDTYRDHWTGIENDKARYTHERIHSVHTHTHTHRGQTIITESRGALDKPEKIPI